MIIICEPVCRGAEHAPFNASIIETIKIAFPNEKIIVYGEKSHISNLKGQLSPNIGNFIIWNEIDLPPRHCGRLHRWSSDIVILLKIFVKLRYPTYSHLVFCSAFSSILIPLKILRSLYWYISIHVILHGNLNEIDGWQSKNPFVRVQNIKTALIFAPNKKNRYIVLEKTIKKALIRKLPIIKDYIDVLEHPIPPNEGIEEKVCISIPIKFAFLGLANENKGFSLFLKSASILTKKYPEIVEFHAIGSFSKDYTKYNCSNLKSKPVSQKLNRQEYINRLNLMHFICFPYKENHYSLSASGALLDAIAFQKPFIATKLPIFEEMISEFGDIGYIVDEVEYIETLQIIIEEFDISRYQEQIKSLKRAKDLRSPDSLSKTMKKMLFI